MSGDEDVRSIIEKMSRDELYVIANKLGVKDYRSLRKSELADHLLSDHPDKLRKHFKTSWVRKHSALVTLIGTGAGILGVVLCIGFFLIPRIQEDYLVDQLDLAMREVERQKTRVVLVADVGLSHGYIREVLVREPHPDLESASKDLESLLDQFNHLAEMEPEGLKVRIQLGNALVLETKGELNRAVRELPNEGIPQDLQGRVARVRADCLFGLGRWRDAASNYTRAMDVDGKTSRLLVDWGNCQFELGKSHEAAGAYSEAIERWQAMVVIPDKKNKWERAYLAIAYHNRAYLRRQIGMNEEAIDDLSHALRLFTGLPQSLQVGRVQVFAAITLLHRGRAKSEIEQFSDGAQDFDDAIKRFRMILTRRESAETSVNLGRAINGLAICRAKMAKLEEAEQLFGDAVQKFEELGGENISEYELDLANALNGLGSTQLKRGKPAAAIRSYTRAGRILSSIIERSENVDSQRDLTREYGMNRLQLAHALEEQRKFRLAVDSLKEALSVFQMLGFSDYEKEVLKELERVSKLISQENVSGSP